MCVSSLSPPETHLFPWLEGELCVTALLVRRPGAAERGPTDGHNQTGEEKKDRPNSPVKQTNTV